MCVFQIGLVMVVIFLWVSVNPHEISDLSAAVVQRTQEECGSVLTLFVSDRVLL